jgi:hypothetical protein
LWFTIKSGTLEIGITVKKVKKGRHRAVFIAERKNQTIGAVIHKAILEDELDTGELAHGLIVYLLLLKQLIESLKKRI